MKLTFKKAKELLRRLTVVDMKSQHAYEGYCAHHCDRCDAEKETRKLLKGEPDDGTTSTGSRK